MTRTAKTEQVMNLVKTGNGTDNTAKTANPFVLRDVQEKENIAESTHTPEKKRKARIAVPELNDAAVKNPALKIPDERSPYSSLIAHKPVIGVVSTLINEYMGEALRRFNSCKCDKCCQMITQRVTEQVEPVFICIETKEDAKRLENELERLKPTVIQALAREIIKGKVKPLHDINK